MIVLGGVFKVCLEVNIISQYLSRLMFVGSSPVTKRISPKACFILEVLYYYSLFISTYERIKG